MKKSFFLVTFTLIISALSFTNIFAQERKVLIVLQENGSSSVLTSWIENAQDRANADRVIDALAETFEDFKVKLQADGRYNSVVILTDNSCTRPNLLNALRNNNNANTIIDLLILGHGSNESLKLKVGTLTGGVSGNIRALKTENNNQNFKLRLVYMVNCKGGSTADDWMAIGAKTVVGCPRNNYMPEPQTTWFFDDFLLKNKNVTNSANDSYNASKPFYSVVPCYQTNRDEGLNWIDCSKPTVYGDGSITFDSKRLTVGQTKSFVINAKTFHNETHLYMRAGEKYKFTVSGADKWKNGLTETTANGYQPGVLDAVRRQSAYNMMTLVGEIFREDNTRFYQNNHFKIGTSRTYTAEVSGFLICHANDNPAFYNDNSGSVTLTIERLPN